MLGLGCGRRAISELGDDEVVAFGAELEEDDEVDDLLMTARMREDAIMNVAGMR